MGVDSIPDNLPLEVGSDQLSFVKKLQQVNWSDGYDSFPRWSERIAMPIGTVPSTWLVLASNRTIKTLKLRSLVWTCISSRAMGLYWNPSRTDS